MRESRATADQEVEANLSALWTIEVRPDVSHPPQIIFPRTGLRVIFQNFDTQAARTYINFFLTRLSPEAVRN